MTMETFNNKATPGGQSYWKQCGRPGTMGGRLTCDIGRIIIGPVSRVPAADGRSLGTVNSSSTLLFSALFRGWTRGVKGTTVYAPSAKLSATACLLTRFVTFARRNIAILISQRE